MVFIPCSIAACRSGVAAAAAILLLAGLALSAGAQERSGIPLTADDAVALALTNNPEIHNAGLQVERAATWKTGAWDFSPLQLTGQFGQLYSTENDRYLSVNQNFGSLLARIRQYGMAKKQVEVSLSELEIGKRSLTAQVKSAYYFWWFMHEKLAVARDEAALFEDTERIAALRYRLGECSELEKAMASAKAAAVRNDMERLGDEAGIAENKLKQLLMTEEDLVSPSEPLPMYRVDKPSDTSGYSHALITSYYAKSAAVRSAALKAERARFFPELSAGVFRQDISPYKGLTGWHVGLSFPLLAFGQASKIKEAAIGEEIAMNRLSYEAFIADKTIENLVAELTMHFRQLQYYDTYALEQAAGIIHTANLQFEKEELDYTGYVQSMSAALAIKIQYLETLNRYNQTAIQLEFYAY